MATKVAFMFLLIAILASRTTARTAAVAAAPDPLVTDDFSFFSCISFVPEAVKCVIDVFKHVIAPHPSCCKAISKLHDCSSKVLRDIPSDEMVLIKSVCSQWGVSIS